MQIVKQIYMPSALEKKRRRAYDHAGKTIVATPNWKYVQRKRGKHLFFKRMGAISPDVLRVLSSGRILNKNVFQD